MFHIWNTSSLSGWLPGCWEAISGHWRILVCVSHNSYDDMWLLEQEKLFWAAAVDATTHKANVLIESVFVVSLSPFLWFPKKV